MHYVLCKNIYCCARREVRSAAACVDCCRNSYYRQNMSELELSTFVKKFLQLKKAGATAHLDVDTRAGEAWVRLSVQLQKPTRKPRRSPSYYRRMEKRKAAAAEATAGTSSEESQEKVDDNPAAEASESVNQNLSFAHDIDAEEVTLPQSSQVNWINALNHVTSYDYSLTNLEAVIIDTIASVESIKPPGNWSQHRRLKCKHCKHEMVEPSFFNHTCGYNRKLQTDYWPLFQDDIISRVEPGDPEVMAICSL